MRKLLLVLGVAALAAGLPPGASGLDVPLKFEKALSAQDMTFPYGYWSGEASALKPPGNWKLPALTAEKPLYVMLSLGDRKHLMVLDSKKAGESAYTRIWIDSDGDGDLSGEKPLDGRSQNRAQDNYFNVDFSPIDLQITVDGVKQPYRIQPWLYGVMPPRGVPEVSCSFTVLGAYSGVFKAGTTQYTIKVGDRDGNGRYADRAKAANRSTFASGPSPTSADGDAVILSAGKGGSYSEIQALGDLLLAGDTLFGVKVDIAKGKLVLTEIKNGLSPVKLAARPERLSLLAVDGSHCVMAIQPPGDVIRLPAGNYQLLFYEMYRKDAQGDLWRILAGGTGDSPVVPVSSGSGATLALGEPFTPVVTLLAFGGTSGPAKGSTNMSFVVQGQGKEVVTEIARIEGTSTQIPLSKTRGRDNRPKEPSYTIVKADGEIVAKGTFEYG